MSTYVGGDEKHEKHALCDVYQKARERRLSEAAKALATRDHVRDIGGLSALSNRWRSPFFNIVPTRVSLRIRVYPAFRVPPPTDAVTCSHAAISRRWPDTA
jgi:hypothetical protein